MLSAEGGGSADGPADVSKEQMILNYAKTSFQNWKKDPVENSELALFSLFMQLNDGDSDLMASWDEI